MITFLRPLTARRRLLVMAALLVGAIAPAGTITPTTAAVVPLGVQAGSSIQTFYYRDSSKTVEVGYTFRDCNGFYYKEGVTSPYYERFTEPCR